jgi:hypothetical protein
MEVKLMKINAIETIYDGYKFRSRLEARWAVFFKEAGIKYLYENEGYALPSGWYLPDFYLPELNLFVEVKQVEPTDEENQLMAELITLTQKRGTFAQQIPNPNQDWSITPESELRFNVFLPGTNGVTNENDYGWDTPYLICHCCLCGAIGFVWEATMDRVCNCAYNDCDAATSRLLTNAYVRAKQARFEHGECG